MSAPDFNLQNQQVGTQYVAGNDVHVHNYPPGSSLGQPPLLATTTPGRRVIGVPEVSGVFTGRVEELERLKGLIVGDNVALTPGRASLRGMGGVGKTQTAARFARDPANGFDTVLWVEAETPEALDAKLAALAPALVPTLDPQADAATQTAAVRDWLTTNSGWLLVVDNAENLDHWRGKLPAYSEGRVLLTTRHPVPTDFARPVEIETLDDDDGALLLLRRAGRLDPDATLDAADPNLVADAKRVSARLGGLALALDQAGAYLAAKVIPPARYRELYEQKRQALHPERGNPDHATVAVTFALALEQVEAIPTYGPAATQLVRLCAFLGPDAIPEEVFRADPEEIQAPLNTFVKDDAEWLEVVAAAIRYSLMRREREPLGLSLHRLYGDVIRDSLDEERAKQTVSAATDALNSAFPVQQYKNWLQCAWLIPHALLLLRTVRAGKIVTEQAGCLAAKVALYLVAQGEYMEAEVCLRDSFAIYHLVRGPIHRDVAASLSNLSRLLHMTHRYDEALTAAEDATSIYIQLKDIDSQDLAAHLNRLAAAYYYVGKHERAESYCHRAIALLEKEVDVDVAGLSTLLCTLSLTLTPQKKFRQAEEALERAVSIRRGYLTGPDPDFGQLLLNLGSMYVEHRKFEDAKEPLKNALLVYQQIFGEDNAACSSPHYWLGALHQQLTEYPVAAEHLRKALTLQERAYGPDDVEATQYREQLRIVEGEL